MFIGLANIFIGLADGAGELIVLTQYGQKVWLTGRLKSIETPPGTPKFATELVEIVMLTERRFPAN